MKIFIIIQNISTHILKEHKKINKKETHEER